MEWIKVEDRLPRKNEDVLVWAGLEGIQCWELAFLGDITEKRIFNQWLTLDDKGCPRLLGKNDEIVTHWMPLPEAPADYKEAVFCSSKCQHHENEE